MKHNLSFTASRLLTFNKKVDTNSILEDDLVNNDLIDIVDNIEKIDLGDEDLNNEGNQKGKNWGFLYSSF